MTNVGVVCTSRPACAKRRSSTIIKEAVCIHERGAQLFSTIQQPAQSPEVKIGSSALRINCRRCAGDSRQGLSTEAIPPRQTLLSYPFSWTCDRTIQAPLVHQLLPAARTHLCPTRSGRTDGTDSRTTRIQPNVLLITEYLRS